MSLLIDYSKNRAEINPSSTCSSILDVSHSGYDDLESSWTSFANDDEEEEKEPRVRTVSHIRQRPLGKIKQLDNSNGSHDTATTADISSSSSDEDNLVEAPTSSVSFRIKRRSSMGFGSSQEQQQPGEDNPMEHLRILRAKRFSDTVVSNLQKPKPAVNSPHTRRRTLPDRADSIKVNLQIDSWKKRQLSLLSASAELATVSDRDLFQRPGRRGSIPQAFSSTENINANQRQTPKRNRRSRCNTETLKANARPSVPIKSISMRITRSSPSKANRAPSFRSRRPTKTHSLYCSSSNSNNNPNSPSSKMLLMMNLSRALPIGQQQRRRPEQTRNTSRTRSNSFRRRGSIDEIRSNSQHSLTKEGTIRTLSRRRSLTEATTTSTSNSNNDFVTGSRIRRLGDQRPAL